MTATLDATAARYSTPSTSATSAARSAPSGWTTPRPGAAGRPHLKTLLAIVGPGLIVMVGDNDAGAFATYGQAGQNYGTRLLWTLLLLVPVLYVNQEMVLRLGAVTGVGHARLILERFGKFWGAFSVIDLFILNALTIVTEFIGITLAAGYLGLPKVAAVVAGRAGDHRRGVHRQLPPVRADRRRRCAPASLLLIPIYFLVAPARPSQMAHGFVVPAMPGGAGQLSTVMLLIIGIVGTTVAPWQLFFQQCYVIDKRITPRFIKYEKADLWIGIVIVVARRAPRSWASPPPRSPAPTAPGTSPTRPGSPPGLQAYAGRVAGVLFAIALLDASIIGAFAVSLSTAYAIGDVLGLKHSLHRGVKGAKGFYAIYGGPDRLAAATVVLIPGSPLGLLTEGVQVLAGVLLPSASVFLLLLCNDQEVLGPVGQRPQDQPVHRRGRRGPGHAVGHPDRLGAVPGHHRRPDPRHHGRLRRRRAGRGGLRRGPRGCGRRRRPRPPIDRAGRENWRMPPLALLQRPPMSTGRKIGMAALRLYLAVAMILVIVKIVELALGH